MSHIEPQQDNHQSITTTVTDEKQEVISTTTTTTNEPMPNTQSNDSMYYQPRVITLHTTPNGGGSFGFHLKGPLKSGRCMRFLNGRLYPPLHYIYCMDQCSSAIKSGLRIYDTILEINDVDVAGLSYHSIHQLIGECEERQQIKLKVMYPDCISTVKDFDETPINPFDIETMKHLIKSTQHKLSSIPASQSIEMIDKLNLNSMLDHEKKIGSNTSNYYYLHPTSSNKIHSNYYTDDNIVNIICIPVVKFIKCEGKECAFYEIYQGDKFLVSRRYNDFKSYDKHMRSLADDFPLLPGGGWSMFMDNVQIDTRRIDLEGYLKKVTSSLILLKLAATRLFLGLGAIKYNERIITLWDPSKETSPNYESDNSDDSVDSVERNKQYSKKSVITTNGGIDAIFSSCDSLNLPNFVHCNKKSTKYLISIVLADHSLRLPLIVYEHQTVFSVMKALCKEFNFPAETIKHFSLFHCSSNRHGGVVLRKNCVPFQIFLQNYIHHHQYSLCLKRWRLETDNEDIFLKTSLLVNILYSQLCFDMKYGNMDERESSFIVTPVIPPDLATKIKILKTARNFSSYATFRINIDSFNVKDLHYNNCVIILSPFSARICLDSETDQTTIFSFNISDVGKPKIIESESSSTSSPKQSLQLDITDINQYSVILVTSNLGYLLRCLKKVFKTRECMSVVSTPNQHPY